MYARPDGRHLNSAALAALNSTADQAQGGVGFASIGAAPPAAIASFGGARRATPPPDPVRGEGHDGARQPDVIAPRHGRGEAKSSVDRDLLSGAKGRGGRNASLALPKHPLAGRRGVAAGNGGGVGGRRGVGGIARPAKAGTEQDVFDKHEPTIISASSRLIFYTGPANQQRPAT